VAIETLRADMDRCSLFRADTHDLAERGPQAMPGGLFVVFGLVPPITVYNLRTSLSSPRSPR